MLADVLSSNRRLLHRWRVGYTGRCTGIQKFGDSVYVSNHCHRRRGDRHAKNDGR